MRKKLRLLALRQYAVLCFLAFAFLLCTKLPAQTNTPTASTAGTHTATVNPIQLPYSNTDVNSVTEWDVTHPGIAVSTIVNPRIGEAEVKQTTQYFDGLGRPIQTVQKHVTPDNNDLVAPVQYDAYGREVFKYLPYASTDNDGNFKTDPFNEQNQFYHTQSPDELFYYSKTDYEASPLNRVLETYAPGNSWVGSNAGTTVQYLVNTTGDNVYIWNIGFDNGSLPAKSGTYDAGQLYKTVTTDENGNVTMQFTDKENHIILKKAAISNSHNDAYDNWLCTYYVYDDLGNLRFVMQPEAVVYLSSNNWVFDGTTWSTSTVAKGYCFSYEYDERQRMIIKRVPDAGEVRMVYDARDRLVMSQDENLRASNEWLVTVYDDINRPTAAGKLTDANPSHTHAWEQQQAANSTSYPNTSSNFELLTNTYYDDYTWVAAGGTHLNGSLINTNINNSSYFYTPDNTTFPYPQPIIQSKQTRGMVTGTAVKVLGTNPGVYLNTVSFYDSRERVIQTQSTNYSNDVVRDTVTMQYSFGGQLLRTLVAHKKGGNNPQNYRVCTKNFYDNAGRLIKVAKLIGNQIKNSTQVTLSQNSYDELGQLTEKDLGQTVDAGDPTYGYTSTPVDVLKYDYNIRGWLRGINKDYARNTGSNTPWFGMELCYDYGFQNNQLNGNIAGERWRSRGDGEQRAYGFSYDMTNRLKTADYNQLSGSSWDKTKTDFTTDNIGYGANGNITTMNQMGMQLSNIVSLDQLVYTYNSNSNRLDYVKDNSPGWNSTLGDFKEKTNDASSDYSYTVNGNLKSDNNKGISSITYDYLNQPLTVSVAGKGTITYTYDATGNKLRKVTVDNTVTPSITTTTDYIGPFVYKNDTLQYISTEEGRARTASNNKVDTVYYDYFEKDHLGNVRVVLTDQLQQDVYPAATLEGNISLTGKPNAINTEQNYYTINTSNVVATPSGMPSYQNNNGNPPYNNNPYSNTGSNSSKVYKLTGTSSTVATGLNMTLKVMSGDVVDIFGTSYWNQANTTMGNKNQPLTDLLAAFLATPDGLAVSKGATVTGLMTGSNPVTIPSGFLNRTPPDQTPMAFINYILFDERFQYVTSGFSKVDASGYKSATGHHADLQNISVTKNGYLYVYCSNQSPVSVYFDNLQVILNHGPLVEETHYYPFGLTMAGISSQSLNFGQPDNNHLYNDKELQNKEFSDNSGLELYDYSARTYDPQLGRWETIDPLADDYESLSPYGFVRNNPLIYVDPDGMGDTIVHPVTETALVKYVKPIKSFKGFWGSLNYYWTGGIVGHWRFNKNGEPIGLAPIGGTPPDAISFSRLSIDDIKDLLKLEKTLSKLISAQKQARHLLGSVDEGKGFLNTIEDAQKVLDAVHSGKAELIGTTKSGNLVVKFEGVTGTNVNLGKGITSQSTNVFMIKGSVNPSVVPINPNWKP